MKNNYALLDAHGGPAFPCIPHSMQGLVGMSLRDYFAAKAMQGMLADHVMRIKSELPMQPDVLATVSYKVADAMLAERSK